MAHDIDWFHLSYELILVLRPIDIEMVLASTASILLMYDVATLILIRLSPCLMYQRGLREILLL